MDDLDFPSEHPIGGFFASSPYTDFKMNALLVVVGPLWMVLSLFAGRWGWAGFGVLMTLLLLWNYRRYRQRVVAAVAERSGTRRRG